MISELTLVVILAPCVAGLCAGILGQKLGKNFSHSITIMGVFISFICALKILMIVFSQPLEYQSSVNIYQWGICGYFNFYVGFLIDRLSAVMMAIVLFISLVVHIYSMGYMKDDPGYQRFFSYISLFTFAMLMLVTANNFLQLYFGWEGVGLVSYLLIGFWFKKDSANFGSLKAFLINRVGDFGFLLGIAAILDYTKTLDILQVFSSISSISPHVLTVICLLIFMGAMGKSAQMPLHIWLPESMEGPTPISALIHAATMVTAGIYLVARLSPLYEHSTFALNIILIIGATTALLTGIVALVQNDIKRVVAYSTLSQLGYMVTALGASAYSAGIYHLLTHAFFKALLFLAAGSVIVAMHHEQDMRRMGNLKKYMPITYFTFLIAALALSGIPPFSGFFSKDLIIDSVHFSQLSAAHYAFICLTIGVFITPLYIFRAFFMTFYGEEKFKEETREHLKESPWQILLPLILLAIPSIISGWLLLKPLILNHGFGNSIMVLPQYQVLDKLEFNDALSMMQFAVRESSAFYLALLGIATAWVFYIARPKWPGKLSRQFSTMYKIIVNKYGFDLFNEKIILPFTRWFANKCFLIGDIKIVDDIFVNGSARVVSKFSSLSRRLQSGYLYHYVLVMAVGLLLLLCWMMFNAK
jgi:NADH-quinone oxidoreductase subunit L